MYKVNQFQRIIRFLFLMVHVMGGALCLLTICTILFTGATNDGDNTYLPVYYGKRAFFGLIYCILYVYSRWDEMEEGEVEIYQGKVEFKDTKSIY